MLHGNLLYTDRKCFHFVKGRQQLVTGEPIESGHRLRDGDYSIGSQSAVILKQSWQGRGSDENFHMLKYSSRSGASWYHGHVPPSVHEVRNFLEKII